MSISPRSHVPIYRQLAGILREQIETGQLAPDAALPSEARLSQEYGVGRVAARMAVALLRSEGLVTTIRGHGSFVRGKAPREDVPLPVGGFAIARMPTEDERIEHDIDEGVPVVEIQYADGSTRLYEGHRVKIMAP